MKRAPQSSRRRLLCLPALLALAACAGKADHDLAASCAASGGTWVADSRECEIGEKTWCDARSGRFDSCASPCRNTSQRVCATVCVPVCALPER